METTYDSNNPIIHDIPPYIRVYKNGTVERLFATEVAPPSLDPQTGVRSKDVTFEPQSNLKARIYCPDLTSSSSSPPPENTTKGKLPLVIYFHGGAFFISSMADPKYHNMLNLLVKESNVILVSVDYRLAPEHPLPTAYEDSWAALKWVASHKPGQGQGQGDDPWIKEYADLDRVYLAGDSAGANISHHMALKLGLEGRRGLAIDGILMVQPYFWGKEPIGAERENEVFKSVVDKWWLFVCPPSGKGCDDPWINPFGDGAAGLGGLACGKVLICVAGNDVLRERGKLYYKALAEGGAWGGEAELFLSEGEGHVFHIMDPTSDSSTRLLNRCARFFNGE